MTLSSSKGLSALVLGSLFPAIALAQVTVGDLVGTDDQTITATLNAAGYEVVEIEREDDELEVEVIWNGEEWEIELSDTGHVIEIELDD